MGEKHLELDNIYFRSWDWMPICPMSAVMQDMCTRIAVQIQPRKHVPDNSDRARLTQPHDIA